MNDNDTTATNEHEHEHEHGKVDGFKFTGEAKIWFSNNWESLDYIKRLVEEGGEDKAISHMSFTNTDMTGIDGWTCVGEATIEVRFYNGGMIREEKVASLKKEIQQVKAKAQREVEILEDKLQQLLALPSPSHTKATNEIDSEDVV